MKPGLLILIAIVLVGGMLAVALYIPNSLSAGSDFSALYNTDLALVNRAPIYDLEAVEALAVKASGVPPEKFFLARFPYPPWYALSTFYLGLLPAQSAATLWFEINIVMLLLSIWLLTDGWNGRLRLITFPLALFFLPVLGALSVGQYDFPVLLGTSLLIYALRRENTDLITLGAVLLTFKPHVGVLVLLSLLIYLISARNNFGQHTVQSIMIAGFGLLVIGFIADPKWVIRYPAILLSYQGEGNVSSCSECVSLPVFMSRWFFDGSLKSAILIAVVVFILLFLLFYQVRTGLLNSCDVFLNTALLTTLLICPYLYNYDFLLLLAPFIFLVDDGGWHRKILVGFCYLMPTLMIAIYGRSGNITLLAATLILSAMIFLRVRTQVDANRLRSYNTNL